MARDLAAENGDVDTSLHAVQQMGQEYQIEVLTEESNVLKVLAGTVRNHDGQMILISTVNELATKATSVDRYELAKQLADLTLALARKTRENTAVKDAIAQVKEIQSLEKEYLAFQGGLAQLAKNPLDPDANLTVGRYYCCSKGDWDDGLPKLALGSDSMFKALAERDLAAPTQLQAQVNLGDDWWNLASSKDGREKKNLVLRAQHWYSEALPSLSGLTKARVQKRLDSPEQPKTFNAKLPSGTVVAFDFEKSSVRRGAGKQIVLDKSNLGGDGEIVNGKLVPGVHGSAISLRSDGYVKFSDKSLPIGDSPRSILFWARIDELSQLVFFSYGSNPEGDATYTVVFGKDDSQGRGLKLSVGNPGGRGEPAGSTVVADGKWHHMGLIYDGKGTAQLFVDGKLDLSFARRYRTSSPGQGFIGQYVDGGARFTGAVDDFIIVDRALSLEEINSIKDIGLTKR